MNYRAMIVNNDGKVLFYIADSLGVNGGCQLRMPDIAEHVFATEAGISNYLKLRWGLLMHKDIYCLDEVDRVSQHVREVPEDFKAIYVEKAYDRCSHTKFMWLGKAEIGALRACGSDLIQAEMENFHKVFHSLT